jgi:uncharacterized protein (DUF305 family)
MSVSGRLLGVALIGIAALTTAACGGSESTATPESTSAGSAVPFDSAFIDAMVPHHRSAIAMAKAALRAGLSESDLISVADNIVSSQQTEINQMRGWRENWFGSSVIDPRGADSLRLTETEMGMQHGADFSGAEDVNQAFATMMIDHHRGAIRMAELAQEQGRHEQIKSLADAIIAAQEKEIAVMEKHAGGMHHEG